MPRNTRGGKAGGVRTWVTYQNRRTQILTRDVAAFEADPDAFMEMLKKRAKNVPRTNSVELLSVQEIRDACIALGITTAVIAEILGVTPSTVRRWCVDPAKSTYRPITPTASNVIRWMLRPGKNRPVEWPRVIET